MSNYPDYIEQSLNFSMTDNLNNITTTGCELMELDVNGKQNSRLTLIISALGAIICIFGIIGNVFSIIVLCKKSMKKLSTYSYLLGLSICDELSLILTVFIFLDFLSPYLTVHLSCETQVNLVNFNKVLLYYIVPIVASTQALSVWITLAFTIDRYFYVCKPFYGVKYCTRQRASLIICLLYLLASIYSIPQFLERKYVKENILGMDRIFLSPTELGRNYYFITIYHLFIYSVFVTLIPFFVIILLNGFLVYEIIRSRKRHRKMSHTSVRYTSEDSRVKMESITGSKKNCFAFIKRSSKLNKADNNQPTNGSSEPCLNNYPKFSMTSQRSGFNFGANSLRNDVTLMLVGLIVVFFICQAPSTVLRLITFKNLSLFFKPLYQSTLDISNFLVVCNSTVNCILYVMLGKKFRAEFFKTFCPKMYHKNQAYSNSNNHNSNYITY